MLNSLQPYWPAGLALVALVSAALGMVLYAWWARREARLRRRAPKQWPLRPRVITNGEERKTWRWMAMSFMDYSVMVKMPVTRYTTPSSREHGLHWYELLSSLYCTFTVVRSDGRVMGCVDLIDTMRGPNRSKRMKAALLGQCGIPYLVIDPSDLPSLIRIRTEFLGESAAAMPDSTSRSAAVHSASAHLRESLTRHRRSRHSQHASLGADSRDSQNSSYGEDSGSQYSSWQDNSFLVPLDSRQAELR